MSGIGDQGMMPEHVRPQRADDDTVDERVAVPPDEHDPAARTGHAGEDPDEAHPDAGQSEVDEALAGISDDERADAERFARLRDQAAQGEEDTRSQRNP